MTDYRVLRKCMVEEQLIPRGISSQKVLEAFYSVERHKFVPAESQKLAYADSPLLIGENQTISQPYIVALMTECLDLTGRERVLEIGTGSGYQTAILAELSKEVFSIERFERLAQTAQETLQSLGFRNIQIKTGDGSLGWKEESPFDRIIITAASPIIPDPLIEQLNETGKLILPLGGSMGQILTKLEKKGNEIITKEICGCVFVPLVGKYGYKKEHP